MYGVGGRRFYAIAVGDEPLVVQAGTAEELCALMRETEAGGTATPSGVRPVPESHGQTETHRHGQGDPMIAGTPDGLRTVCWDIPRDPATVGEARRMTRDTLTGWGLAPEFADDAVLVVGELVANATLYGQEPIRLSLWGMPRESAYGSPITAPSGPASSAWARTPRTAGGSRSSRRWPTGGGWFRCRLRRDRAERSGPPAGISRSESEESRVVALRGPRRFARRRPLRLSGLREGTYQKIDRLS